MIEQLIDRLLQNRAVSFVASLKGMVGWFACLNLKRLKKLGWSSVKRKDFRMNTIIKILQNGELHLSLVEYFT